MFVECSNYIECTNRAIKRKILVLSAVLKILSARVRRLLSQSLLVEE